MAFQGSSQRRSRPQQRGTLPGEGSGMTGWVREPEDRSHSLRYIYSLTIVSGTHNLVLDDPVPIKDAADECKHGRLAGDRSTPCGCFPGELHQDVDSSRTEETTTPQRRTRKAA